MAAQLRSPQLGVKPTVATEDTKRLALSRSACSALLALMTTATMIATVLKTHTKRAGKARALRFLSVLMMALTYVWGRAKGVGPLLQSTPECLADFAMMCPLILLEPC